MEQIDLLYSGLIATALFLSLWTAVLITAACVFFAPALFASLAGSSKAHPAAPNFGHGGGSKAQSS